MRPRAVPSGSPIRCRDARGRFVRGGEVDPFERRLLWSRPRAFVTRSSCRTRLSLVALLVTASGAGCGPIGYIGKVAKGATAAVAEAKAAGAEELAPYEYWSAVTYLNQAKTLMAYSEYERSFDYGARAQQWAAEATRKAREREAAELARRNAQAPASSETTRPSGDAP